MKFVIQRVDEAKVTVDNQTVGEITQGFVVLVGVCDTDTYKIADKMIHKLLNLRIFSDENDKTNLDLKKIGGDLLIISQFTLYADCKKGDLLIISQFTLYADCKKGNRPSFINAGKPDFANEMYEYILKNCQKEIPHVAHGVFGAHMKVSLINNGPFTVILDSNEICG